jgi:hypothetical protein
MMGRNITDNPSAAASISGITLMWAGLAVLSGMALALCRKLLRH